MSYAIYGTKDTHPTGPLPATADARLKLAAHRIRVLLENGWTIRDVAVAFDLTEAQVEQLKLIR